MNSSKTYFSLKPILAGVIVGVISSFFMLSSITFLLLKSGSLAEELLDGINLFILAASAFASGYTAGYISKIKGLIYGFFCGTALFIIMIIGGMITGNQGISWFSAIKCAVGVSISSIGGIIGVNKS